MSAITFGHKVIDIIESRGLKTNTRIIKHIISLYNSHSSPEEAATTIFKDYPECIENPYKKRERISYDCTRTIH